MAWQTTTPILIMGSQDWNSQDKPEGFFAAGAERQKAILRAAKRARQQSSGPHFAAQQAQASGMAARVSSISSQGGFGSPQSFDDQLLGGSQPALASEPAHTADPQPFTEAAHPEIATLIPDLPHAGQQADRLDESRQSLGGGGREPSPHPGADAAAVTLGVGGSDGRRQQENGIHLGGGAMLLVLAGSSHHSFHDVLALFSTYFKSILKTVITASTHHKGHHSQSEMSFDLPGHSHVTGSEHDSLQAM